MYIKYTLFYFIMLCISFNPEHDSAQAIYIHTDNETIYDFVGELATQKQTNYNSVVLPLTRKEIAGFLDSNYAGLNARQEKEKAFFFTRF
jgi:hypothetical protein